MKVSDQEEEEEGQKSFQIILQREYVNVKLKPNRETKGMRKLQASRTEGGRHPISEPGSARAARTGGVCCTHTGRFGRRGPTDTGLHLSGPKGENLYHLCPGVGSI